MVVGTLELALKLEGCFSLKDKRRILRSMMDRSRRDFQVSIAEVEDQDLWNSACLGVAYVSNNARQAEAVLQAVLEFFDSNPEIVVESAVREINRVPG